MHEIENDLSRYQRKEQDRNQYYKQYARPRIVERAASTDRARDQVENPGGGYCLKKMNKGEWQIREGQTGARVPTHVPFRLRENVAQPGPSAG